MACQLRAMQWVVGLLVVTGGMVSGIVAGSEEREQPRYGDLARLTYPAFQGMITGLSRFDEATLPHEAKGLRRQIGDVWYRLEIFAYAYPADEQDLFIELVTSLRWGYDRMGDFKDLFDRQLAGGAGSRAAVYDDIEVKRLREPVLDWRRKMLEPSRREVYRIYVQRPSREPMYARSKSLLSDCYWGGVAQVPARHLNGFENLRVLMAAQSEMLGRQYREIRRIDDVLDPFHHRAFHDFRVRVRCVLSMVRYFPLLTAGIRGADRIEQCLDDLVARYGDLNDIIMAFETADAKGTPRAEGLRNSAAARWSAIREWQTENRLDEQFEVYGSLLRQADRR